MFSQLEHFSLITCVQPTPPSQSAQPKYTVIYQYYVFCLRVVIRDSGSDMIHVILGLEILLRADSMRRIWDRICYITFEYHQGTPNLEFLLIFKGEAYV